MDPMLSVPRRSSHSLVPWHPPLRHGPGRHPLWERRADLQCRGQLSPRRVNRMPGADPRVPSHPAPRPTWPARSPPPSLADLFCRRGGNKAAERQRHITPRTQVLICFLQRISVASCHLPALTNNCQSMIGGMVLANTKLLSGQHHPLNDREREEQHLKTNHANLNPVDNSVWKIENWKLLSFCNVPYRSKFPTKWIEDLCAPLAYMGGTKNLAYTCFRLPAKTYLLVNLRKRLHVHLKKQNQRIYIFNKRKKKF